MAKEKKRYCSICSEEISVPFGLLYFANKDDEIDSITYEKYKEGNK